MNVDRDSGRAVRCHGLMEWVHTVLHLVRIEFRKGITRTYLGPFWGLLGVFAAAGLMGVFFGTVLKGNLLGYAEFIPYLTLGLIVWVLISSSVNDACSYALAASPRLRHSRLPFVAAVVARIAVRIVLFVVSLAIGFVAYVLILGEPPRVHLLPFLFGLVTVSGCVVWMGLLAAILSIRFRDFPQVASTLFQIGFFLTPIIWPVYFLGRFSYLVDLNPAYHLIAVVRSPALGEPVSGLSWSIVAGLLIAGGAVTWWANSRCRDRLVYWL